MYEDSYTLIFAQLHKRLTHLEYKRHVVKALLVFDYLIRLKPPSLSVQLKLIVDIREHWNDVYRLARLRVQSSSATIQQIQRVAERLCEFIWSDTEEKWAGSEILRVPSVDTHSLFPCSVALHLLSGASNKVRLAIKRMMMITV